MNSIKDWINWAFTESTKRYPRGSREIKHDAERILGADVKEREFTNTMIVCGHLPISDDGKWAYFNVAETPEYTYLLYRR